MSNRQKSSRSMFGLIVALIITMAFGCLNVFAGSEVSPLVGARENSQFFTVGTCDGGNNVDVESTGGTALAGYATVKGAFDAINAGTHTGTIIIEICASTTEGTTPATLNGTGQGSASYTSINMYPIADGLTVTGNPATGFGVIQLKGADSVTIDGDNPNSGGTNRNLTISNTNTNTAIAGSVIRVATVAALAASADSITLRNMILSGNVTGGNVAAITSTTGSSNSSFGIFVGGNGGATATDAPTAITSVSTQIIPAATTVNSFVVNNNAINQTARGVVFNGAATNNSNGVTVSNNTIGSATPGDVNGVYSMGMTIQGSTLVNVSGNTIYVESYLGTSIRAIDIGSISTAVSGVTIEKNRVARVWDNSTSGFGAYGINLAGGSSHIVQNNFIYNINAFLNNSAISSTFGPHGIRAASGTGHTVYHNSVNIFGAAIGATSTSLSSAMTIVATTQTGMNVRNNIFANTMTGAFSASTPVVAMFLPSGGTSAMNLTLNNNDYFQGSGLGAAIAQSGTTSGTGVFLAADFNAGSTSPAANLRSYTSTLSAAGTNDNASKVVDPLFISNTDLHIQSSSTMESAGANLGVTTDIDNEARGSLPDIGADEITLAGPGALQLSSTTYGGLEGGTANATVNRVGGVTGAVGATYTLADVSAVGGAACTAGVDYINPGPQPLAFGNGVSSQPIVVTLCADAVLDAGETFTITLSAPTGGATLGSPTVATVTIQNVAPPFTGSFNVGTGEAYTSLTNPGGIFEAINLSGATGNVTINITTDLAGETGAVPLNEIVGGFNVLIKPSGAARVIATTAATSFIKLAGTDNVTIDGSLSGGTDRSLTVNGSAAGAFIWVATNATSGANSNTVKNVIFSGPGAFSGQGVIGSSGTTFGGAAEFPNSNNTIRNNAFSRVQNALFATGNTVTPDQNWTIADNTVGSATVADKLSFRGFFLGSSQNFLVTNNAISGVNSSTGTSSTMSGIQLNGNVTGTVSRNVIKDIKQNNTTGWGSNGIFLTGAVGSNVTIANNFISDVASQGFNGQAATDNGHGISVDTGSGYNIYHNTIVMNTNQGAGAAAGHTSPILVTATVTAVGAIDLRDNILVSTQTLGTRYGVIDMATTGATVFSTINRNDYFAQNVGRIGATTHATLLAWQGATTQDANSLSVDPLFVSLTDFHLTGASPMLGAGQLLAAVPADIDTDLRDNNPDIGADEIPLSGRTGAVPAGTYRDGYLGAATLSGNVDFTGVLNLTGMIDTGAFTLGITCTGSVTGAATSNYIIGNMRRDFCSTGSYLFTVGSTPNGAALTGGGEDGAASPEGNPGEYSPMTATINGGTTFPSSLTVNVVDTWLPNLGQTSSISRYWNVTETGNVNADMLFQYLAEDVYGDEPNYKPFKWDGVATTQQLGSEDAANNQFTATGVTSFSGWAAGVRVINAAEASIGGRVTTSNGNGIRNATVRLTGGDLTEPRVVQTGALGSYNFPGLHVGQTYVLEVSAKRFRFGDSTRIISLQDDLINVDFTANPNDF